MAPTRRDERGFTLVELLVVIVVIGILAGIVGFAVGSFRDSASTSACMADVRQLMTANAAYVAHEGTDAATVQDLINAGYLKSAPESGVTFANGVTDPASVDACGAVLALTPGDDHVVAASGSGTRIGSSEDWTITVMVSVVDADGAPVSGASVTGSWSDAVSPAGCQTGSGGTCLITSVHTLAQNAEVTWTRTSAGSGSSTVVCEREGASGVVHCDPQAVLT